MSIRTRMAPSPTGEYHVGHIRTLLYNFALARKNNGKFIIRIEDTDRNRYVEGAVDRILEVVENMGFSWDEDIYTQSEHLDVYKKYALELVEKGQAYYCFCTPERLKKLRADQQAQHLPVTKYDRKCLGLSDEEVKQKLDAGEPYVIRLKVPENQEIVFNDLVFGEIKINSKDIDDQVLLKADGYPTYHLAVVVDDHLMGITHVMRGNDWIPSTPKHVLLYQAFGWDLPIYAHLPNLKEVDGTKKLSKRFGSVAVADFLAEGYLPEALNNFLMFLGWNPGTEKEIYSISEFIADFSIERIQKTDLVSFDRKKLLWLNGHYIRELDTKKLWEVLDTWANKYEVKLVKSEQQELTLKILSLVQGRMKVLSEYNSLVSYFYEKPQIDSELLHKFAADKTEKIISEFIELYKTHESWEAGELDKISHEFIEKNGYTPKEAFMTLRVAVTGSKVSPPIFEVLEVLGKDEILARLEKI